MNLTESVILQFSEADVCSVIAAAGAKEKSSVSSLCTPVRERKVKPKTFRLFNQEMT